jgi:APA family basic amino acid/polyamine antiporter
MSPSLPLSAPDQHKKIGFLVATTMVIANMVGTGVFTSLGFQAVGIKQPLTLLLLWFIGGLLALCGGFCYAELGSALPRSGGEYHYLTRLFHPRVGFLSGWVSLTIGFSAPIALAAMAFGHYFYGSFHFLSPGLLATTIVVCITTVHLFELRSGGKFQFAVTLTELLLISFFILCGIFLTPHPVVLQLLPTRENLSLVLSPAFAVSLVYVSYAYSGWNCSTYLANEIKNPSLNIPRSILTGTGIVLLFYVLLNYVFLRSTPINTLAGQLQVGLIASVNILGPIGGRVMGLFIALCLVSSISSMVIAGPRILKVMGEDYPRLSAFSRENSRGIPWIAVLTQSAIALLLLWTSTFEKVLIFVGFTLALFTSLSVIGVFILRIRKISSPDAYKTTGFPFTPIIFLVLNLWMIGYLIWERPRESSAGLGLLVAGIIMYNLVKRSPAK